MMRKSIFSFCAMLAFAGTALAEDTFSVDNVTLPLNGEADVLVRFSLDEGSTCSGYTFWLRVPDELAFVTYEKNSKTYITYTAGDSYDDTPTLTPNLDEGYLKVGCLTANSDPLNKRNGILVTFRIKTSTAVNVGDIFNCSLTKGTISAENGTVHDVADASFTVTVSAPVDTRVVLDETSTTVPEAAADVDVRVKRTINANEWSTICLPFDMTEAQVKAAFGDDVQLAEYMEHEMDDGATQIRITFDNAHLADDGLMANYPYIIKTSKDITEFTVDDVTINPDEEGALAEYTNGRSGSRKVVYGTFKGTFHAQTVVPKNSLFLSDNKFWYSKGLTKMKAFRAYFDLVDVLGSVEDAGSRINISFNDSETTGIKTIGHSQLASDSCFDLQGRKVETKVSKGLYIMNGKKTIVR